MFENIFLYIALSLIAFFPIVIWAYIFSYIDDNSLNKKRFFLGILGGALSVVPILYIDKILAVVDLKYLNVFLYASEIKGFLSSIEFGISLSVFLLLIVGFSYIFGSVIHKFKGITKIYLKNIVSFLIFILLLSILLFFLNIVLSQIDFIIEEPSIFEGIIFNSFKLIVFYYLIVAFIEEASKHFNFLQSSVLSIKNVKDGVLYAIFVALGFAFVENLLYLYNYYNVNGFNSELLQIYFLRSTFSTIVHILCSSVVAYYFSKALILYRDKDLSLPYLKIFLFGFSISILLHLFYDVALTLGFGIVMFIYFLGGYLYVSSIFYKD